MRYFRVTERHHQPGMVLSAGHWGSVFETYRVQLTPNWDVLTDQGPFAPWRLASELIFETVRLKEFPNRPSRLECAYVWDDEAEARKSMHESPGTRLEEVEIIDPDALRFRADFFLVSAFARFRQPTHFLPSTREVARKYWAGKELRVPELLVMSDLRVLGPVA